MISVQVVLNIAVVTGLAPTTGLPLPPGVFGGVVYERLPRVGPPRYPGARGLARRLRGAPVPVVLVVLTGLFSVLSVLRRSSHHHLLWLLVFFIKVTAEYQPVAFNFSCDLVR